MIPFAMVGLTAALVLALLPSTADAAISGAVQWQPTTYTAHSGAAAQLDFYSPPAAAGPGPFPAIVVVHGGAWTAGDKVQITGLAQAAARHGYVVVNTNYPYAAAGAPGWDGQVRDVETVIGLLRANAAALRTDPHRIAIWGHSAGATIATMVAERGVVPVQAAVGFSGLYDLAAAIRAAPSLGGLITAWTGCDPTAAACRATTDAASPVTHVTPAAPPMLLAQSTAELAPVNQIQDLDAALTVAGVAHHDTILDGTDHGWRYPTDQIGPALAWLDSILGSTPPSPPYDPPTVDPITTWYLAQNPQPGQPVSERYAVGSGTAQDLDTLSAYYTAAVGVVHTTKGAIRDRYRALAGPAGFLGFPTTDESRTPDGVGRYNHFAGTAPAGSSIYWTPGTGAHEVLGAIRARWATLGWERSYLGYPTSGEYAVPGGRRSDFQRGHIDWTPARGAVDYRY